MAMKQFLTCLYLLERFLLAWPRCSVPASEFQLGGDFLLGGLFDVHHFSASAAHRRPEAIDCSRQAFSLASYRRLQVMRFSVEEINNSSGLLPNVSLGYDIYDHCSDTLSFPGVFKLMSVNGSVQPWVPVHEHLSKVVAVVGPFESTDTLTVAPLFMKSHIPMVNYGATTSVFSKKHRFPSFLRTVHTNEGTMRAIVSILQHFKWRWVAFLLSDDHYSKDGLELFTQMIKDTQICLAYIQVLKKGTDHQLMFRQIASQRIPIILVFSQNRYAESLIKAAIRLNVSDKVWIAGDTWSLNKKLPKERGVGNIGTVLGVSELVKTIPGFSAFIYASKKRKWCETTEQKTFCSQVCKCEGLNPQEIILEDPSFSVAIHTAVYAVAHALHGLLQCGGGRCDKNIQVYPHMVLAALRKSNFTLLDRHIQFDKSGDLRFGSYSIRFWNESGEAEEVGFYKTHPSNRFFINNSQIQWHSGGEVPTSHCSSQCDEGFFKRQDGIHACCFICSVCPKETYINSTVDPFACVECQETEWSEEGSTSCSPRSVEYVPFTDITAVVILVGSLVFDGVSVATVVLFALKYDTPVVRSAGGPMCFLILLCLCLCSLSVFFYFGKPTASFCILRFLPFLLFYTPCLACFVVRSFQIVCVFKVAAKFPRLYACWMKYHGQWLVIAVAFGVQALFLVFGNTYGTPRPFNDTFWYPDKIILGCEVDHLAPWCGSLFLLGTLCTLCFIFSYMGKDLPKNYNEAKSITLCLLLLTLTWIVYATEYGIYHGKYIQTLNSLAVLCSLYWSLICYFLPKCYIIIFQPHKNTQQYFQGLIQSYTKTISN